MKRNMKIIVVLMSALYILLPGRVYATPDPSNWYKVDLIGANRTNMFYYLTHEELPGSYYYSFTHYYLVSMNIETGKIERKVLLRKTRNTTTVKDGDVIDGQENIFVSDVSPMELINKNHVEALYPNVDAGRSFKFDRKGTYYVKDNKRIDVLTREYLDKFLHEYDKWYDWGDGISIIQVYSNRIYYFYLLQYGVGGDIDLFQTILPVKRTLIR